MKPIVCCWVSCCTHITLQWWCDGCVFMPKQLPILNYHMPKRQLAEGRKHTIVAVGRCGGMKVVLMRFLLKYMRLRWSESALRRAGRKKQGRKLRQVRNLANKLNTQQQQYTERVGSFRHMKIPSHGRSLTLFSLCIFSFTFPSTVENLIYGIRNLIYYATSHSRCHGGTRRKSGRNCGIISDIRAHNIIIINNGCRE